MSNDAAGQTTQNADGQAAANADGKSAASEIARFYSGVSASGFQPRLRFVSGVAEFNIIGAGTWRIIIKDGTPTVTQDTSSTATPDCVVTAAAEDFLRIVHREENINILAALLQGLITVTGDFGFATMVLGGAILEPDGSTGVEAQA